MKLLKLLLILIAGIVMLFGVILLIITMSYKTHPLPPFIGIESRFILFLIGIVAILLGGLVIKITEN